MNSPLSQKIFTEFIESDNYRKLKQTECFIKQAKHQLRNELEKWEGKRHVFNNSNMVAKFVPKKIWETDHPGLIEDLFCYSQPEYLFPIITLDKKKIKEQGMEEELLPYLLPTTRYVRPTMNKIGKKKNSTFDYLFGGQTEEELISEIKWATNEFKLYQQHYEDMKTDIIRCPELQKKLKINSQYGSISLLKNSSKWDISKVYENTGEEFLIQYGNVDVAELESYMISGVIPKQIVSQHRKITDIRLDFIVMSIESEEKIMNIRQRAIQKLSLKRNA